MNFEGQTVFNEGLIQIEGTVEISADLVFTGADTGAFLLENGGQLVVEGSVGATQQIVFMDGTGLLTVENIAGFEAVVAYAELPTPSQPAGSPMPRRQRRRLASHYSSILADLMPRCCRCR